MPATGHTSPHGWGTPRMCSLMCGACACARSSELRLQGRVQGGGGVPSGMGACALRHLVMHNDLVGAARRAISHAGAAAARRSQRLGPTRARRRASWSRCGGEEGARRHPCLVSVAAASLATREHETTDAEVGRQQPRVGQMPMRRASLSVLRVLFLRASCAFSMRHGRAGRRLEFFAALFLEELDG